MRRSNVFVYGTLRKGGVYHRYLATSRFVGEAVTPGFMRDHGRFPIAYFGGGGFIKGEVYQVNSQTLGRLDSLEGFDSDHPERSFYIRRKICVKLMDNGDVENVWAYEFRQDVSALPIVESGDWLAWSAQKEKLS